jgi:small GTP-binding protein
MASPPNVIEAKIVVLGSQGVGKTTLVHRYVKNTFIPPAKSQSTVGASFLTTRVNDPESGTTIRLQIWDTAGQERFRSISKLYYRGAHAAILCYDVTSQRSFDEMGSWLQELREQCGLEASRGGLGDMIIHVVGTKSDVTGEDPKSSYTLRPRRQGQGGT